MIVDVFDDGAERLLRQRPQFSQIVAFSECVVLRYRGVIHCCDGLNDWFDQLAEHGFLICEVIVESTIGDVCILADFADAGAFEPVFKKMAFRAGQ